MRRLPPRSNVWTVDQLKRALTRRKPEADFQSELVTLATDLGWWVFAVPANVQRCWRCFCEIFNWTNPGWPDLVLLRREPRPRFLVRELKSMRGEISPSQSWVIETLRLCGVDAGYWRPSDRDRIERELAA